MIAYFDAYQHGTFSLTMTLEQAKCASHPGNCDDDVAHIASLPKLLRQRRAIGDDNIRAVVSDASDWDTTDADENWQRLVWMAAGDIVEAARAKRRA